MIASHNARPSSLRLFAFRPPRRRRGAGGPAFPWAARLRTPRGPRGGGGFTLVEVLVVVTIVGIAGMIVIPQMLQAGTMQIQAAGRMIIADLLFAQNEAIARQAVRAVTFEVEADRYRLTDAAGQTITANWKSGAAYVVDFQRDSRFSGVRLDRVDFGGSTTLSFDDLGTPSSGGTIDLVSGEERYRITVAPFTGRVTIATVEAEE